MTEEQFKIIKDRLSLSEGLRENFVERWKRWRRMYENDHYSGVPQLEAQPSRHDKVTVPYITGLIRTIIPSVFTRQPKWFVFARKEKYKANVPVIEKTVDYFWNELKLQKLTKKALLHSLVTGYSAVFCAYLFVTGKKGEAKMEKTKHRTFRLSKKGDEQETFVNEEIVKDSPYFENLDPLDDVLIDPMATSLHPYNGRYAIRKIRKTEKELKEKFPDIKDIKPDSSIKKDYVEQDGKLNKPIPLISGTETEDTRLYTLYEYWTKDERILFLKEMDKPLKSGKNPYFNEIPIVFSENYEMMSRVYPMGEVELAEPMTRELDKTRSQIINHRKRFNRKYGYDKEKVTEETINALENPEDGTIVPTIGNPNAAISPIQDAALPSGVYENESAIKSDFQFIMANYDYTKGGRQTATEVREIADTSFSRKKEKMQNVEELSTALIEKLVKLLQWGWDKKDLLPFVDEQSGSTEWIEVSPEKMEGDFIFKFQQGSTEPLNEELMMKRALDTYNLFARDESGDIDQYELKKWVLQTLKIQNIEKILPGKPKEDELIPGGALPPEGGEAMSPGGEQLPPVATQLPRRPPVASPAASPGALAGGEPNLENILRGLK